MTWRYRDATPLCMYAALSTTEETPQNTYAHERHDPIWFGVYRSCLWGCVGSAFHLMTHPILWIENKKNDVVFERNMVYALDLYALQRRNACWKIGFFEGSSVCSMWRLLLVALVVGRCFTSNKTSDHCWRMLAKWLPFLCKRSWSLPKVHLDTELIQSVVMYGYSFYPRPNTGGPILQTGWFTILDCSKVWEYPHLFLALYNITLTPIPSSLPLEPWPYIPEYTHLFLWLFTVLP